MPNMVSLRRTSHTNKYQIQFVSTGNAWATDWVFDSEDERDAVYSELNVDMEVPSVDQGDTSFIRNWSQERSGYDDALIVQNLRKQGFSGSRIVDVLRLIDVTCPGCWNSYKDQPRCECVL